MVSCFVTHSVVIQFQQSRRIGYYRHSALQSSVVAIGEETRLLTAYVSLVLVAVVEETRLLPAFGSSYIGAVVYATWLLLAYGSEVLVAVVYETRLLMAFGFLLRDATHPRYQPWACVYVCLCLSQVGVLLKRLNVGSHKQHYTIVQGFQFSEAKDLGEIRPGSPPTGAPNAGGVNIGDFRQITGYISKTVKDRHIIVSNKVEQESYALYRMVALPMTLSPPNHPVTPFSAFCTAIHSYVTGEPGDFKFGTLTYHSKSHPADGGVAQWWNVDL